MSRPKKPGLEYFPKDTDVFSDRKIRRLLNLFGSKGYIIYEYVLCLIYQDKGHWLQWDKNLAFDVADNLGEGIKETLVDDVLNTAMKIDLFSVSIYEKTGVITSKGIQERYVAAKRNKVEIAKDFLVNVTETRVNVTKTIVSATETPVNVARSTQSKVKESKVKESKVKKDFDLSLFSDLSKEKKQVIDDWISFRKEIKKPLKTERSLKSLIKTMNKFSVDKCHKVIHNSMDNEWQGLFWDNVKDDYSAPKNEITESNEPTITFRDNVNPTKRKLPKTQFLALEKQGKAGGYVYEIISED